MTEPDTQQKAGIATVLIGTAGSSYEHWEGVVYPSPAPPRFDRLAYMSQFFDVLEINNTFYRPPSPKNCESWVRRTSYNKRFMFTVKLHQKFTHEREGITPEDEVVFKRGIEPIDDAGRLGCILMQFPWSFKYLPSSRRTSNDRRATGPNVCTVNERQETLVNSTHLANPDY